MRAYILDWLSDLTAAVYVLHLGLAGFFLLSGVWLAVLPCVLVGVCYLMASYKAEEIEERLLLK